MTRCIFSPISPISGGLRAPVFPLRNNHKNDDIKTQRDMSELTTPPLKLPLFSQEACILGVAGLLGPCVGWWLCWHHLGAAWGAHQVEWEDLTEAPFDMICLG